MVSSIIKCQRINISPFSSLGGNILVFISLVFQGVVTYHLAVLFTYTIVTYHLFSKELCSVVLCVQCFLPSKCYHESAWYREKWIAEKVEITEALNGVVERSIK